MNSTEHPAAYVTGGLLGLDHSSAIPIGRVEATGAVRLSKRVKLKIGGAVAFPGKAVVRFGVNVL